jgi:hypothetical protein
MKMGTIGCPETFVADYQSTLRNIPEEQRLKPATTCTLIIVVMGKSTRRHNSHLQFVYTIYISHSIEGEADDGMKHDRYLLGGTRWRSG